MSCNVVLENYNNAYYAGQVVVGRVECSFNSEKKVKAIHVRLTGKASVRWTESESYYDSATKKHKSRQVTYWAEEEYFSVQINLVHTSEDSMKIPAGRYTYPFQYILPANLPSSLEGSHYRIRYKIKATVDRPWKFDYEAQAIYNVFAPIDLNYMPELKNAAKSSDDKTVCCFCCSSGPIEIEVGVSHTGFAVGQRFLVSCHVSNLSNVRVESIKFKLNQYVDYTARSPRSKTRTDETCIVREEVAGVGAHGENTFNIELVIPQDFAVPNPNPCSIINARYCLYVEGVLPGMHSNLDVTIPVRLGHVALNQISFQPAVAPVHVYSETAVPLDRQSSTNDWIMIDDVTTHPTEMPVPPGMPAPMGMPAHPPGPGGPPYMSNGPPQPFSNQNMPMPAPYEMPMPHDMSQPVHPMIGKQAFSGYMPREPNAPQPGPPQPTAPQMSVPQPNAPPSYDQAMAVPEKKPF